MKNTENASKILKNGENYTERDEVYLETMQVKPNLNFTFHAEQ